MNSFHCRPILKIGQFLTDDASLITLRPIHFSVMDRETAERIVRDGKDIYTSYLTDNGAYDDVIAARNFLENDLNLKQYSNGSFDY